MIPVPRQFRLWGVVGAFFAALFALWMFFFPGLIPSHFAWTVEPRLAQAFIGAGYVFRTFFFLLFVFERDWRKLRWTPWGNLVFTATLLLATIWHAEEVNWRFLVAHLWVILYTIEPVTMFFLIPRGAAATGEPLTTGGPLGTWLRRLLIFEVAALGLFGLFLFINPTWLDLRWPWALTKFDAGIIAAWFLGWAVWAGSIALAADWDEVRRGVQLNILFGAAVCATIVAFRTEFDFSRMPTLAYAAGMVVLTLGLGFLYWRQERARPGDEGSRLAQVRLLWQRGIRGLHPSQR